MAKKENYRSLCETLELERECLNLIVRLNGISSKEALLQSLRIDRLLNRISAAEKDAENIARKEKT